MYNSAYIHLIQALLHNKHAYKHFNNYTLQQLARHTVTDSF